MTPIGLEPCGEAEFAWLLGERAGTHELRIAPDLAPPEVMAVVRGLSRSWMIVDGGEVVGLISLLRPICEERMAEIGYGVAPSREGRGFASRAVASLLDALRLDGVAVVTAENSTANPASRRVLEHNRFDRVGVRDDPEDGPVDMWRIELT